MHLPAARPGNFKLVEVYEGFGFIAGHGPFDGADVVVEGAVGREVSLEEGYRAAKLTALSIMATGAAKPLYSMRYLSATAIVAAETVSATAFGTIRNQLSRTTPYAIQSAKPRKLVKCRWSGATPCGGSSG